MFDFKASYSPTDGSPRGPFHYRLPQIEDYLLWREGRASHSTRRSRFDLTVATEIDLTEEAFTKIVTTTKNDFAIQRAIKYYAFRDKQYIGNFTISNILHDPFFSCEIGFRVLSDFWRNGVAEKMLHDFEIILFQKVGIHRIEALCETDNIPSTALLKKSGYALEGVMREKILVNGTRKDMNLYAKVACPKNCV